jgi:hypothetical protein
MQGDDRKQTYSEPTPDQELFEDIMRRERRSRRYRQERLDQKAGAMQRLRARQQAAFVPDRDDVARAVLHVILRVLDGAGHAEFSRLLKEQIIEMLTRASFSTDESRRVLERMIERCHSDRERWFVSRQVTVRSHAYRRRRAGRHGRTGRARDEGDSTPGGQE